ncbi:MAG: hypothetical protein CMJ68_09505 [Planctomycetaceae bacterium]|nr:hypothetical protein [Planctomycetaceae bacterium]
MTVRPSRWKWILAVCLAAIVSGLLWSQRIPSPPPDLINSIGMRFRNIPAGQFLMGAIPNDMNAQDDEKPRHPVILTDNFFLGQFEVTQRQFHIVMGTNPSWFRRVGRGQEALGWSIDPDTLPVEMVSWQDAVEFCNRLGNLPEERTAGRRYRLPTEAEWEYACRAGTTTRFEFGEQFDGTAANMNRTRSHPLPCGSFAPNRFGLFDMHGNVLEWCSDWHSPTWYSNSPVKNPRGPESPDEDHHVLRGGGWGFPAASCSFRDRISTFMKGPSHGFRVVCEIHRQK